MNAPLEPYHDRLAAELAAQIAELPAQIGFRPNFLIGLSGGVDSVALLHLFCALRQRLNFNLRAIHIHHGLSPNADAWAAFCQQRCEQWQVPLAVCPVVVSGKQGVEANARAARYRAISQHILPNEMFVTAHHLDDQVETFFLSLKRGSGVAGLSAMQAVKKRQDFTLFRPLLAVPKSALLDYAHTNGLGWINDESNDDRHFDRNFLRHEILPKLNARWAQFNQMVARASQHCANQQQLIKALLEDEFSARFDRLQQRLTVAGFERFSPLKQQELVRWWLAECGLPMPSQPQLAQILQLIAAAPDKNPTVQLADKTLRRFQQQLFITEHFLPSLKMETVEMPLAAGETLTLPEQLGTLCRTEQAVVFGEKSGKSHRLHLPKPLRNQPLAVKFCPSGKVKRYGKAQREEMKKLWQQNGVPAWLRDRTPLLFVYEQNAWQLLAILGDYENIGLFAFAQQTKDPPPSATLHTTNNIDEATVK